MTLLTLYCAPDCPRCQAARRRLERLIGEMAPPRPGLRVVDVVTALDEAVAAGVLQTPALVAEGRLLASPLPRDRALGRLLASLPAGDETE